MNAIYKLWGAVFPEDADGLTITSGHEVVMDEAGKLIHSPKSKHYIANNDSGFGEAIDIRYNDVKQAKAAIFTGIVWQVLTLSIGDLFVMFSERMLTDSSHLHIQLK